jgi:MFS family permease
MKLPESLSVLRQRDFRIYWIGQAISLIGTWMQQMAQAWVVASITKSATVLGILALIGSLPLVLLSFKAGQLADKIEKRKILMITQVLLMLLAFAFAGLHYSGHLQLWHIFVMSLLLGVVSAFDFPAAQSMPPELVPHTDISKAVALMQAIFHGARFIGPGVAGWLMAQYGNGSAFIINGLSFIAVLYSLSLISPRPAGISTKPGGPRPGDGGSGEAISFIRSESVVSSFLVLSALLTGLIFPFIAVLSAYYAQHVLLAQDPSVMGSMMSASGLGSLIGALALLGDSRRGRFVWLMSASLSTAACLIGLAQTNLIWLAVLLFGVLSFSVSSLLGRMSQLIQERVPGHMRGRVMGLFSISFTGVMPFSSLLLSYIADKTDFVAVMFVCAILFLLSSIPLLLRARPALQAIESGEQESEGERGTV